MDTISKHYEEQYEKQCERCPPRRGKARHGRPYTRLPATAPGGRRGGGRTSGGGSCGGHRRKARQHDRNEYEHEQQYPVLDDDHGNDYGGGASWES